MSCETPEVKVKSRSQLINKMVACSGMDLVWPGGSHNGLQPPSSNYYGCSKPNTNTTTNNHLLINIDCSIVYCLTSAPYQLDQYNGPVTKSCNLR